MEDRALVEETMRGSAGAFEELARRYQAPLLATAYGMIHHAEDARDLAQEALIEAYRNLPKLRDRRKFRCWLFAILRHQCLRYLEQHPAVEIPLDECRELPAPAAAEGEILDVIARLPLNDREVLAARYFYELDYGEVAAALGINVRAARMRCLRARERLRELLRQDDEEQARLTLHRAMNGLALGLLPADFAREIARQASVHGVESAVPAAATARAIAGWKLLAACAGLLLLGVLLYAVLDRKSSYAIIENHLLPKPRPAAYWSRTLPSGAVLQFQGVNYYPEKGSLGWTPDGRKASQPPLTGSFMSVTSKKEYQRQFLATISPIKGNEMASIIMDWGTGKSLTNHGGYCSIGTTEHGILEERFCIDIEPLSPLQRSINLRLGVADSPWTARTGLTPAKPTATVTTADGPITVRLKAAKRVTVDITNTVCNSRNDAYRLIAVDRQGREYEEQTTRSTSDRSDATITFNLIPDNLKLVRYETRPYHWEEFTNVKLYPAR